MIAGVMLMAFAALRAQIAYAYRFDRVDVTRHFARGAVLYAVAGVACFVAARVM